VHLEKPRPVTEFLPFRANDQHDRSSASLARQNELEHLKMRASTVHTSAHLLTSHRCPWRCVSGTVSRTSHPHVACFRVLRLEGDRRKAACDTSSFAESHDPIREWKPGRNAECLRLVRQTPVSRA
jgi:hypothetical protein